MGRCDDAEQQDPAPDRGPSGGHVTVTRAPTDPLDKLCREAVELTGASSCGVTVLTRDGQSLTAHASGPEAQQIEDLQHTLGEGPGPDASRSGVAVLASDLSDPAGPALERWPTFTREVIDAGVLAAYAFPLLLGTARIGALTLYRDFPGILSPRQLTHGFSTADAVAITLAAKGDGVPEPDLADVMKVHRAAGMAMVQLGVPIDQALLRMRAIDYREGTSSDELADAILRRSRRLSEVDR